MMNKACLMAACLVLLSPLSSFAADRSSMLPKTELDSFVYQALKSGHAEHIYGDEGTYGPPPQMGFNIKHRINIGITGACDEGLTTGHGAYLPDAWGSDEFLRAPGAWSLSGVNHGDHHYNGVDGNDYSPASEGNPWGDNDGGHGTAGGTAPVKPPYQIGANWAAVQNTHNGQIMGWMAPGETFEDFFSGRSGHLLPGWEAEGKYILENQLPLLRH